MSFPMSPPSSSSSIGQLVHPSDAVLTAINSNPYFIGMMMLLLNLGGRFISMEMTKSQEQFFQNIWVRRFLIFTVLFMGTRNIAVAFWMTIVIVLFLGYLLNENSSLCIYTGSSTCSKPELEQQIQNTQNTQNTQQIPNPPPILGPMPPLPTQNINGLNQEESQIYQTLHAKQASASASTASNPSNAVNAVNNSNKKEKDEKESSIAQTYLQNMFMLRSSEGFRNVRF